MSVVQRSLAHLVIWIFTRASSGAIAVTLGTLGQLLDPKVVIVSTLPDAQALTPCPSSLAAESGSLTVSGDPTSSDGKPGCPGSASADRSTEAPPAHEEVSITTAAATIAHRTRPWSGMNRAYSVSPKISLAP
ncbi:hypothetical protein [Agromyces aerolatus]|uniref:hypothetical protein n=1 Tax=Agromyces sp. LY-1074 TaxID=3074080 RepID=UPI00285A369D|nr:MULTISPECIES: hypothetical protein [unclassified Agromyces]MDR5701861.1 hypothetical protein [Agromyces sp. LY-1074]MDR5708066.1 hypothetical protein [Agromyces sp. LY-1358]